MDRHYLDTESRKTFTSLCPHKSRMFSVSDNSSSRPHVLFNESLRTFIAYHKILRVQTDALEIVFPSIVYSELEVVLVKTRVLASHCMSSVRSYLQLSWMKWAVVSSRYVIVAYSDARGMSGPDVRGLLRCDD